MVAPGYRRIALPLPFALRAVNAYLIEGQALAIVDCGLHTPDAERTLLAELNAARRSPRDVSDVFVTHVHPDHIGMAGWLEGFGARVTMHGPEAEAARATWFRGTVRLDAAYAHFERHGMPPEVLAGMRDAWLEAQRAVDPIAAIREAGDGEVVALAGRRLRLLWTPGHTDFHAVLYDEGERVLVAGDHVLPKITPNIGYYPFSRDDPLADFLRSLERVRGLDVRRVLPAHGEPYDDLRGRVDEILAHHRARLDAIREILDGDARDAYAVARALFPVLRSAHEERFAHAEALAHLRHLEKRGEAEPLEGSPVRWRLLVR